MSRGGPNLPSVKGSDVQSVVDILKGALFEALGFAVDLNRAAVYRCDLFRDIVAPRKFYEYRPLYETISFARLGIQHYPTTYGLKNTLWGLFIYDKREEMSKKGYKTEGLPDNLIRYELRLMRGMKVRRELGISTFGELMAIFDSLPGYYETKLSRLFSLSSLPEACTSISDIEGMVSKSVSSPGDYHALHNMVMALGMVCFYQKAGSMDLVRVLLKSYGFDSKQVYRFCQDVTKSLKNIDMEANVSLELLRKEVLQGLQKGFDWFPETADI
jgi:hypothetical protein